MKGTETEIWKDIFGYEGLYQVSSLGRVKSMWYGKEKILKPTENGNGYLFVWLSKDGKRKMCYVHRLVGTAFIQRNSLFDTEINHKDEDKTNNKKSNIEWADRAYNNTYGTRNKRVAEALTNGKTSKPVIGISVTDGTTITFVSVNEAGRQGFNLGGICSCIKGERKSHKGYTWKYA